MYWYIRDVNSPILIGNPIFFCSGLFPIFFSDFFFPDFFFQKIFSLSFTFGFRLFTPSFTAATASFFGRCAIVFRTFFLRMCHRFSDDMPSFFGRCAIVFRTFFLMMCHRFLDDMPSFFGGCAIVFRTFLLNY